MPTPRKEFTRDLAHPLNPEEVTAAYDAATELDAEADTLEAKLKEDTKERKDVIKELRAKAKRRRDAAKARKEPRSVKCHEEIKGWQILVIRDDTGETIDQYAADPKEQTTFAGLAESKPKDLPLEADSPRPSKANRVATEKQKPKKPKKS